MGKKRRAKKLTRLTVYGCVEGVREQALLDLIREIYNPGENNISLQLEDSAGGAPDKIVSVAMRECHRDQSFAWFDEDFEPNNAPLSEEVRRKLAKFWCVEESQMDEFLKCPIGNLQSSFNVKKRKPILIVSQPVCCDSLVLRILGHKLPIKQYNPRQREKQILDLKNNLYQLMNGRSKEQQTEYFRQHLTMQMLEDKRRDIVELDLLISMLTK